MFLCLFINTRWLYGQNFVIVSRKCGQTQMEHICTFGGNFGIVVVDSLLVVNIFEMSLSTTFRCEHFECEKEYESYNNLLRHYRVYKDHKPETNEINKKQRADELAGKLLPPSISQVTHLARVKAVLSCLTSEEIKEHFSRPVVKQLSSLEFFLAKASSNDGNVNTAKLVREFINLRTELEHLYPEIKLLLAENSHSKSHDAVNMDNLINGLITANKDSLCKAVLEAENGKIFREALMPLVAKKYKDNFVEFASGLVGSFCLGQKQLQDVLRNTWGKYLSEVLGINIIPPKALVVGHLKKKKQELSDKIGLKFEVHNEVVVATVDVKKYLEYLLTRPAIQISSIAPQNKVLMYQFTENNNSHTEL